MNCDLRREESRSDDSFSWAESDSANLDVLTTVLSSVRHRRFELGRFKRLTRELIAVEGSVVSYKGVINVVGILYFTAENPNLSVANSQKIIGIELNQELVNLFFGRSLNNIIAFRDTLELSSG